MARTFSEKREVEKNSYTTTTSNFTETDESRKNRRSGHLNNPLTKSVS